MNVINVYVDFEKGICDVKGIHLIEKDYNSTKLVFNFNEQDGRKVFKMKNPKEEVIMISEITNNELILAAIDESNNYLSLFNLPGKYTFEISQYKENGKITSTSNYLIVDKKQIDEDEKVAKGYFPIFENLIKELNKKLNSTSELETSLNSLIEQIRNDLENRSFNGADGIGLDYNWSGTSLGVKKENEEDYNYTDLKGEKGEKGETGENGKDYVITDADYEKIAEKLTAISLTYEDFLSKEDNFVIAKGTLDNVLNEKIGKIEEYLDLINGEEI